MNLTCPLLNAPCTLAKCAWYDIYSKKCCIQAIHFNLDLMARFVRDTSKR